MKCHIVDNLIWLYADSIVPSPSQEVLCLDLARGATASGQVLVETDLPVTARVSAPGSQVHQLLAVPVERNTGPVGFIEKEGEVNPFVTRRAPFEVFDAMRPLTGPAQPAGGRVALYIQVPIPPKARPGRREFHIDLATAGQSRRLTIQAGVHAATIPPVSAGTLKYTNWFSLGNMATRHKLRPWSAGHWRMIRKYADLMVHARQNMFWLTAGDLFTVADGKPALNAARLRHLVELFTRAGMHYIEGPHLAHRPDNQWQAPRFVVATRPGVEASSLEGVRWVAAMAGQLQAEIVAHGWQDRWLQHVTDEPIDENAADYRLVAGTIRRYMPGVKLLDATICKAVAGALDIWVPQNWHYEKDREFMEAQRALGDEIWHYTCCFPGGKFLNRLMDGELLRPTLLHWGNALYDLPGFLHWGLNQYRDFQDPFRQSVVDHGGGNCLPAGDTHIVYPGTDGPWSSVRLEAQREGAEDYELLRQLKARNPRKATGILAQVILRFDEYATDLAIFRAARKELLLGVSRSRRWQKRLRTSR